MNRIYGYCRISTPQQSIDRQIRNIKAAYPGAIIVDEIYAGTIQERPKWRNLKKRLETGDTVVFDSVSRMSRNAEDGFHTYTELYEKGIELIFLKEPHINTETYKKAMGNSVELTGSEVDIILSAINKYLKLLAKDQIKIAFEQAQKEVDDLRQRTREGIETARIAGKQIGAIQGKKLITQKSIEAKKVIRKHSKDFGGSLSDSECMDLAHLSRNTYYKYKRELKQQ